MAGDDTCRQGRQREARSELSQERCAPPLTSQRQGQAKHVLSGDREIGKALLNDSALNWIWSRARDLGLGCSFDSLVRLIFVVADRNHYHPVRDYLEALKWDGVPRLATWLSTYAGAEKTDLNSHFGRVFLLGAVKRILSPGCKFDYALVLEDKRQGTGKSSLVQILGGRWYADSLKLGMDAKETSERTRGVWIQEVPELGGMQNREVEAIKAQITTPSDRARMAYGRTTEVVRRQFVLFCTTNDDTYLKDRTGNRRFLPVRAGKIDLKTLARDRDQLWAEAYARVKDGASTVLPETMWEAAREAQEARVEVDPIKEQLTNMLDGVTGRILKNDLWLAIGRRHAASRTQREKNQLTAAMRELSFAAEKQWHGKKQRRCECYAKGSNRWLELTADDTFV
jgi:predicted P-loop ATPase